ncbi:hypothetical protein C8F01DRAFT_1179347 [Mycena amicta]|nr:hypothetical protein C8F01DRAFT_1179347 [Mycena amicta]
MSFPRRRPSLSPHPRYTQNALVSARITSPVPLLRCQIPWTGAYLGVYFFGQRIRRQPEDSSVRSGAEAGQEQESIAGTALRVGYLREGRYCYCSLVNLFPGTELVIRHTSVLLGNAESSRVPQDWPLLLDSIITRKWARGQCVACHTPWSFISSLSFSYSASLRSPRSRCQDDTPPNRR